MKAGGRAFLLSSGSTRSASGVALALVVVLHAALARMTPVVIGVVQARTFLILVLAMLCALAACVAHTILVAAALLLI